MKSATGKTLSPKKSGFVEAFKDLCFEYFTESSVHGFKYVGERKRTKLERIVYLVSIIILVIMCYVLICNSWEQRKDSPVIVSFSDSENSIWEIPFPAVTICPQTKTHTAVFNYTDVFWKINEELNLTDNELYFYDAISQTCTNTLLYSGENINTFKPDYFNAIRSAAPTLNETIALCFWHGFPVDCSSIFEPVWTDDGLCFSFNSLKSQYYRKELYDSRQMIYLGEKFDYDQQVEWDLENAYYHQEQGAYPRRTFDSGDGKGLSVVLVDRREDQDLICTKGLQGYKIIMNTPGEEPNVSKQFKIIPHEQSISLTIRPTLMATSESLRQVPIKSRKCLFQDERYLRYFTVYTQANCERECLANFTLGASDCVRFAMPRNSSHQICGHHKLAEHKNKYDNYLWLMTSAKSRYPENNPADSYKTLKCQNECYPTCIQIQYEGEIDTQVASNLGPMLKTYKYSEFSVDDEILKNRLTELNINFKIDVFRGLKRSEMYSQTDFIANCGGLLGLCMGISILSFVELFYFFIVKLCLSIGTRSKAADELKESNSNDIALN